jgi:hypothetical protein
LGSSVRRDCASPPRIGFAPEISLRGAGMADRTILARLEAVQGMLAAESAELVAAMLLGVETCKQTPEPGVRKQIEDKLSELQATRVATEQRRRHAVKRIDEARWDLLQEPMWMEESFEGRYPELPIRYVHDGSCVLDRNFGRRPLHEANLLWQPTAASHSFGRPHLLQAEMGMDGDCEQAVFVEQHPAHLRIERAHYLQHELPHEHTVFAARAMGMDGSFFEQPCPHQQAVLVQQHPADSAASHSFGLGQQPPGDKELREQPAGFGQQTVVTATAAGDFCGLQWTAVESLGPELSHLQAAPLAKKRDRGDGDSERRDGGEETTKRAKIDQMPLNVYFRLHWRLALLRTRAPNPSALPMCRICCTSCTR